MSDDPRRAQGPSSDELIRRARAGLTAPPSEPAGDEPAPRTGGHPPDPPRRRARPGPAGPPPSTPEPPAAEQRPRRTAEAGPPGPDPQAAPLPNHRPGTGLGPGGWFRIGLLAIVAVVLAWGVLFDRAKPVLDLDAGDCFNEPDTTAELAEIAQVDLIGCGDPHDFEVMSTIEYPTAGSAPYPGEDALFAWGDEQCIAGFQRYVGTPYEESQYWAGALLIPTRDSWAGGDHELTCVVFRLDALGEALAPSTGSARGSGR